MRRDVSICFYVEEVALALEAGERLAVALATDGLDPGEERRMAFALAALLGLVRDRLHQLRRAAAGELDPLQIWSHRVSALPGERRDVVLRKWRSTPPRKRKAAAR